MSLDPKKTQRGGKRLNAGRKQLYDWRFLLSVQREISILREKHPRTTIKKALRILEGRGQLPNINVRTLARHLEKRRRLIKPGQSLPEVDLLSRDFSFSSGIPAAIKGLPPP
jgi:hypothetical protein